MEKPLTFTGCLSVNFVDSSKLFNAKLVKFFFIKCTSKAYLHLYEIVIFLKTCKATSHYFVKRMKRIPQTFSIPFKLKR